MNIKIYKTDNCKNCEILLENLKNAISRLKNKDEINFEICTSIVEMSKLGIYEIPALEIDKEIISQGVVYSVEDLMRILNDKSLIGDSFKNCAVCDEKGCRLDVKK